MKKFIIIDIDGTIADPTHRLHLVDKSNGVDKTDWDKFYSLCYEDAPIKPIIELVQGWMAEGYYPIFLTGRRESVKSLTMAWLHKNGLISRSTKYSLLMRQAGDLRHDIYVKPEALQRLGITPDDVAYILEDRNSMVKHWRELGYTCLQVAEGDF